MSMPEKHYIGLPSFCLGDQPSESGFYRITVTVAGKNLFALKRCKKLLGIRERPVAISRKDKGAVFEFFLYYTVGRPCIA